MFKSIKINFLDKKDNEFISLTQAAKIFNLNREYLNVLIKRGKLKAEKIGRNYLTTEQWVKQYLQSKKNVNDKITVQQKSRQESSKFLNSFLKQKFAISSFVIILLISIFLISSSTFAGKGFNDLAAKAKKTVSTGINIIASSVPSSLTSFKNFFQKDGLNKIGKRIALGSESVQNKIIELNNKLTRQELHPRVLGANSLEKNQKNNSGFLGSLGVTLKSTRKEISQFTSGCAKSVSELVFNSGNNFLNRVTDTVKFFFAPQDVVKKFKPQIPNSRLTNQIAVQEIKNKKDNLNENIISQQKILDVKDLNQEKQNEIFKPVYKNYITKNYITKKNYITQKITKTIKEQADLSKYLTLSGGDMKGPLKVNGVSGLTDKDIPDNITVKNYLPLTGGKIDGNLTISKDIDIFGTLKAGKLDLDNLRLNNLVIGQITRTDDLIVNRVANLNQLNVSGDAVFGNASFNKLSVSSISDSGHLFARSISADSFITAVGGMSTDQISATGNVVLGSDGNDLLTVNAVSNFNNPVTLAEALTVKSQGVNITGPFLLNGNASIIGKLTVSNNINLATTTISNLTTTGDLSVLGDFSVAGAQIYSGAASLTASSTTAALSVNQTGSGYIARFQKNGTNYFTLDNQGNAVLVGNLTQRIASTSALVIGDGRIDNLIIDTTNDNLNINATTTITNTSDHQVRLAYNSLAYADFQVNASGTLTVANQGDEGNIILNAKSGEIKAASNNTFYTANGNPIRKSGELLFRASVIIFRYSMPAQTSSSTFIRISKHFDNTADISFPAAAAGTTRVYKLAINYSDNIATTASSTWRIVDSSDPNDPSYYYFYLPGQGLSNLEESRPYLTGEVTIPDKDWQVEVKVPSGHKIRIFQIYLIAYDEVN